VRTGHRFLRYGVRQENAHNHADGTRYQEDHRQNPIVFCVSNRKVRIALKSQNFHLKQFPAAMSPECSEVGLGREGLRCKSRGDMSNNCAPTYCKSAYINKQTLVPGTRQLIARTVTRRNTSLGAVPENNRNPVTNRANCSKSGMYHNVTPITTIEISLV